MDKAKAWCETYHIDPTDPIDIGKAKAWADKHVHIQYPDQVFTRSGTRAWAIQLFPSFSETELDNLVAAWENFFWIRHHG